MFFDIMIFESHNRAPVPFSAAYVHQHEECGDQQSHSSWDHINRYQEPNEV